MGKTSSYSSFKDFFAAGTIELQKSIETVNHTDENIANNRLFVWNFEQDDLEEFLDTFEIYKGSPINEVNRQNLSASLTRKVNNMLREGYNPIECMLYASKVINMKLQNDKELQEIIAERIKDVYIKEEEETVAVIHNIIRMWSWVPQVQVAITAIGLIGDCDELLDEMMINYASDPTYKAKVFYALLKNKSLENLERLLKIVIELKDTDEDAVLSRVFIKEVAGYGYEGNKILKKYYDNPAISKLGQSTLKKVMLKEEVLDANDVDDELYRKTLARRSLKEDDAYIEFETYFEERYDGDAFFLARFSRPDIGSHLKGVVEDERVNPRDRDSAIISLGIVGSRGYTPARAILETCEKHTGSDNYAVVVARAIMGDEKYVERIVDYMCEQKEYELYGLYSALKNASITSLSACALLQDEIYNRFKHCLAINDFDSLDTLSGNLQMFWEKKMYSLISRELLLYMQECMEKVVEGRLLISYSTAISIIEIMVRNWNKDTERVLFSLYKYADNERIQQISLKKLKERKIEAPE